ncbi:MAG: hypothetical protein HY660_17915, partial [Armatimonadetes bacterium]|nr:hypothetical protein [Armatimonadota bacterium]
MRVSMPSSDAAMTRRDYRIPETSGEVLCEPGGEAIAALLEANAQALAAARVDILGRHLADLRAEARAQVLAAARDHARRLGLVGLTDPILLEGGPGAGGRPLILSGHQPQFVHPGVWLKYFLLDHLCRRLDGAGVNIVVDSDAVEAVAADVPAMNGELALARETLVETPPDVPYEVHPAPTRGAWERYLDRLRARLDAAGASFIDERLARFAASAAAALDGAATLSDFLTGARRRYEGGPRRYLEIGVSQMAATPAFLRFFLHIALDHARFASLYNATLDDYRQRHRLRSVAQPFPNLMVEEGRVELPFWVVRGGRREPLFAEPVGGALRLLAPDTVLLDLPAGDPEAALSDLRASGLRVRPRALTLTTFCRLCVGDLFIHGVGGGRYDEATDAVAEAFYGIRPPDYMVATATLWLPLGSPAQIAEERNRLNRRLLDLQHSPDRYLEDPDDGQRALIEEKWTHIRAVEG